MEIEATVRTVYDVNGQHLSATFDAAAVIDHFENFSLRKAIADEDLANGPLTDEMAVWATGTGKEIDDFFEAIGNAKDLGVDFGGTVVTVEDREAFIEHVYENRPEVLTDTVVERMASDLTAVYEQLEGNTPSVYEVDRTFTEVAHVEVNETVLIEARTPEEARRRVENGEYDDVKDGQTGHHEYTGEIVSAIRAGSAEEHSREEL